MVLIRSPTIISYSPKVKSSFVSLFLLSLISSFCLWAKVSLSAERLTILLYRDLPYSKAFELMDLIFYSRWLFFCVCYPFWLENIASSSNRKLFNSWQNLSFLCLNSRFKYLFNDFVRTSLYYFPSRFMIAQKFFSGNIGMM